MGPMAASSAFPTRASRTVSVNWMSVSPTSAKSMGITKAQTA